MAKRAAVEKAIEAVEENNVQSMPKIKDQKNVGDEVTQSADPLSEASAAVEKAIEAVVKFGEFRRKQNLSDTRMKNIARELKEVTKILKQYAQ